ncbi:MAG: hypothetical protein EBZ29_01100 [Synechococcaceae bacterium WB9_4xC_028]|nr:hypothetical protein [Synechococcaceae bacterium WB9_4xC_028]
MSLTPELQQRVVSFVLRGLRIGASTVAILELLRSDWRGGLAASLAWLVFVQVERRRRPLAQDVDQIQSQIEGPNR